MLEVGKCIFERKRATIVQFLANSFQGVILAFGGRKNLVDRKRIFIIDFLQKRTVKLTELN